MTRRNQFLITILLLSAMFAVFGLVVQPAQERKLNDFSSFWAGAQCIGDRLYDPDCAATIQHTVASSGVDRYIRPPFYAVLLWPLGHLPYRMAYVIWVLLAIASVL